MAHAHFLTRLDSTPRCAIVAPEKQSGKTRVLEVTESLKEARRVRDERCTRCYRVIFDPVTDPHLIAARAYAERVRGRVERGEVHPELAWLALIADLLATSCDPAVPEATRAELLTVASTWAVLRRNAMSVEVAASTWPPVPDDASQIDAPPSPE